MGDKDIKEEFNVEEASRRAYEALMDRLRSLLAGDRTVRDRPVLPSVAEIPSDHPRFEVVMGTNTNQVTFLFRRQDLYLEAYQRGGSETWYEFREKNQKEHAVKGSEFLPFSGSYSGTHGLEENAANRDRSGRVMQGSFDRSRIPLGRYALRDAVNTLATSDAQNERARSLIGDFSNGLLRSYARPDLSIFPIVLVYDGEPHTYTFEIVVALIGLLAHNVKGIPKQCSTRSANDDIDGYPGRALLEVFEVIVNDMDEESKGDMYGKITVTDGLLSQYIYDRDGDHTELVNPKQKATLTGPTQSCFSALDNIIIAADLMDKDKYSGSDQVSKGEISWSVYDIPTNVYDKPLVENIHGIYGSVNVVYGVFSNAVQAFVEVIILRGEHKNPADVYGSIFAGNNHPDFKDQEIVLFHRERDDVVQVREGAVIPLSRSIVAVPLDSKLVIWGDMFDRNTTISDPDVKILHGTDSFSAQLSGDVYVFGTVDNALMRTKVTWIS
ncbi:uncharacterized protein LOC108225919 [Daucus carota subsp. sativus]|uniref:uncharacterized protein LOC108225919 n=1 Tax=Daucus carota subsp. sativus TaxID=79200 RepID=UPI0007F03F8E|nr:PREDICTED: uncharacterized protein LOC108225919 [Daucus carota subsp. sativus]